MRSPKSRYVFNTLYGFINGPCKRLKAGWATYCGSSPLSQSRHAWQARLSVANPSSLTQEERRRKFSTCRVQMESLFITPFGRKCAKTLNLIISPHSFCHSTCPQRMPLLVDGDTVIYQCYPTAPWNPERVTRKHGDALSPLTFFGGEEVNFPVLTKPSSTVVFVVWFKNWSWRDNK